MQLSNYNQTIIQPLLDRAPTTRKVEASANLASDVQDFIDNGGKVSIIPIGVSSYVHNVGITIRNSINTKLT